MYNVHFYAQAAPDKKVENESFQSDDLLLIHEKKGIKKQFKIPFDSR